MALLALTIVVTSVDAQQPPVNSSVTVSAKAKLFALPNHYQIDATGKVTMGATHVHKAIQHYYLDPAVKQVAPFLTYTPPASGKTHDYNSYQYTTQLGNWEAVTNVSYTIMGGGVGLVSDSATFTVP